MIISWWSAGGTSAVATKIAIEEFGSSIKPIYFAIDSAHDDNARFKKECEEILYDVPFSTWNLDFSH